MKRRYILIIMLIAVTSMYAQETISGTYTYTYGDNESLVDARNTCKELAIREAIESYHVFIQSETVVENFQLKSDIITTVSGGSLKNIAITAQEEEDRTITISVTAEVDPEEMQTIIDKMSSELTSTAEEETTAPDPASQLLEALDTYNRSLKRSGKNVTGTGDPEKLRELLTKYKPKKENRFQWLLYTSLRKRVDIVKGLRNLQVLETKKRRIAARAQMKKLNKAAVELQGIIADLEKINLEKPQYTLIRAHWISRCRQTQAAVRKKNEQYRNR